MSIQCLELSLNARKKILFFFDNSIKISEESCINFNFFT